MNIQLSLIVILTSLMCSNSSYSMDKHDPRTQRPNITKEYMKKIRPLFKSQDSQDITPSQLQKSITDLMEKDNKSNIFFSNKFSIGLLIQQISNKDSKSPYMIALMLNTQGAIAWLEDSIKVAENHSTIAHSMGYTLCKLVCHDKNPFPTAETILNLQNKLNEDGRKEFSIYKAKAIAHAKKHNINDLAQFLKNN